MGRLPEEVVPSPGAASPSHASATLFICTYSYAHGERYEPVTSSFISLSIYTCVCLDTISLQPLSPRVQTSTSSFVRGKQRSWYLCSLRVSRGCVRVLVWGCLRTPCLCVTSAPHVHTVPHGFSYTTIFPVLGRGDQELVSSYCTLAYEISFTEIQRNPCNSKQIRKHTRLHVYCISNNAVFSCVSVSRLFSGNS